MRTFYFLRHGQTDWNVEGRMQGQTDIPLNEAGIAQAVAAASHYAATRHTHPIDRIISSPLQRAAVTARHVANGLGLKVEYDNRLMERCCGTIEGMTKAEIERADPATLFDDNAPADWQGFVLPRGGESIVALGERGRQAVAEALANHPDDNILFVAHAAWFRAVMYNLTGGTQIIRSDNAVPYRCAPADDNWDILALI